MREGRVKIRGCYSKDGEKKQERNGRCDDLNVNSSLDKGS
jgi:hypothetical protein